MSFIQTVVKLLGAIRPKQPGCGAVDFAREEVFREVGSRFRKVVEQYPERLAVDCEVGSLTYRDLSEKADRISSGISGFFSSEGKDPVAVMTSHSGDMVGALLGVVFSGRPYLFLDPELPRERLRFMLLDSGARLILAEASLVETAIEINENEAAIISLAEIENTRLTEGEHVRIDPTNPFCINYTSGTTRRPLGVRRSHQALLGNIRNMTLIGRITYEDRISCLISPSFGAAAMDIFGAILNGACVVPFNIRSNGTENLPEWVRKKEITFFHSVPTVFRSLVSQALPGESFPSVRWVLLGGERVYRYDWESFKMRFSTSAKFQNVLGMTEGAGILCSYVCDSESNIETADIPVGFPVEGKTVFIGDKKGNALPDGEKGEIIVKSDLVSDGYLGGGAEKNTFRTAEDESGLQYLFTGDLGEKRPSDGALFWRGRKDQRVKISGHRVSLAEVEEALLQRGEVAEAAVTAEQFGIPGETGSGTRLLGWIVATPGSNPDSNGLRRLLMSSLSPDSIPARFFFLKAMPLLPNGKIDRKALSSRHDAAQRTGVLLNTLPRSNDEALVASAFESALGISPIYVYDHFFEIGGDSLAAMNALGALSARFECELTSEDLIQHPTAASIAEAIPFLRMQAAGRRKDSIDSEVHSDLAIVPMVKEGNLPPVVVCPGGEGSENELLVFVRMLVQARMDRPIFGLRFSAFENELPSMSSLSDLAETMVKSLLREEFPEGWVFFGECGSGALSAEIVRQLSNLDPPKAPSRLVLFDAQSTDFMKTHGVFNESRIKRWEHKRMKEFFRLLQTWNTQKFDVPLDLIVNKEMAEQSDDPTFGWQEFSSRSIDVHVVEGDHLSYIRENAEDTAKMIQRILSNAKK